MRSSLRFMIGCSVAASLAACAVEDEAAPSPSEATEASASHELSGKPGDDASTSSPVWYYLGTESCFDFFLQPCTDGLPNNQYPGIGPGLACPQSGLWGNKRLFGNAYFEQYICG